MRACHTAVLLGMLLATGAGAQRGIEESRRTAIVQAIEKAAPAVVSINVVEEARSSRPFPDFWEFFYGPRMRKVDSVGSGFIFDPRGHILTNFHVIEDARYLRSVTLPDGRSLEVEYVGGDLRSDLAVLRASGSNLPSVPMGRSDDLLVGEWVIAIGNPFGGLIQDPQPSVSVGVVSANHRRVSRSIGDGERLYQDLIQTDAAINPGNSGGPLVNARGEVIGVNTMIFSPSGGSVGLGFAIPVNRAKRVAEEIIAYGRRRDPWTGIKVEAVQSLRPTAIYELGLRVDHGCLIVSILQSAPAFDAGLRPGDVILEMNGMPVNDPVDMDFVVWDLFVGDTLEVKADRQGKRLDARFTIQELTGKR